MSGVLLIDLNDRGLWNKTGNHSHRCPECGEDVVCEHTCTMEPDQCDWTDDDYRPQIDRARGAITACDACRAKVPT